MVRQLADHKRKMIVDLNKKRMRVGLLKRSVPYYRRYCGLTYENKQNKFSIITQFLEYDGA